MGLIYAEIELSNGGDVYLQRIKQLDEKDVRKVRVNSLVDSGAYMLVIDDNIRFQLELPFIEKQIATLAADSTAEVEIVGPVEIRFENRRTTVDAMVFPGNSEILLGVIPREDMDVLIDPKQQKLVVNPKHPYKATKHVK